ncbi:hypothetical protein FRC00_007044 [Tulasnella sp. 408]|nr:hypothetical protein FRC00_007044 [Tulasnella sp. 408]
MFNGGEYICGPPRDALVTFSVEDIAFRGRDGHECEEFVQAIHKAAYAAGKLRDDAWMADLAVTCLSGKALRYYDGLEPEVKRDWSLLRPALVARYSPPDDDEDEVQAGGYRMLQVLAPTGPSSPRLKARIGRIKVIGANSTDYGYLGNGKTCHEANGIAAGVSAPEAIRVGYVPANKPYEIEIRRSDGRCEALGVRWLRPSPSARIGCTDFAAITAFNYEGVYRSSKLKWSGPGYTRIWKVMADGTVYPHLEERGSYIPLHCIFHQASEHKTHAIDVAADGGAFVAKHSDWTLAKLLFEPIVQNPEGRPADEA